jgi:ABC-type multidrug transport system fused ATPase/permease subunit
LIFSATVGEAEKIKVEFSLLLIRGVAECIIRVGGVLSSTKCHKEQDIKGEKKRKLYNQFNVFINKMQTKEGYSWNKYIKDYWYLLLGRRFRFSFFTVLRSLSNLIPFAIAYLLGQIIDFFTNYSGQSLNPFYTYVGLIGFLGGFQVWLRFYSKVKMQTIAADIRKESRITAMNKIMELDLKWHETEETGSKIQKINQGGESVYQGIKDFSNEGISILVGIFGALILFLTLDLKYLAFSVIFAFIYFAGEKYYNKKLNYWQDELNKIKEKVSGKIHESASNILAVKSLGLKETFGKYTSSYEEEYYKVWQKTRDISQQKFKTIKIFSAVAYALFILILGFDVINGLITVGSIYIFASYFGKLKGGLDDFTNKVGDFISVKSGVGRFMTILDIDTIEDESKLNDFPKNWKKIEFKDVDFKYKNQLVLKNFNLVINKNDKIGFVGKSGSGKSTIAKLILKLYKPEKGEILVDGINLNQINQNSITKYIGIVLQEPEMFNLSALENICISSKKSNGELLDKAVSVAQLKSVIDKLPENLNTLIGEKGYQLSGGERQRIGIARAIFKDTPILIFDEATSALDSKTEGLIQRAINQKLKNKTLLLIAHRLSTLKEADTIVVLEKGKIIESGTFEELFKLKGRFYQLYKAQSKK